jgi:hypothetical protein
MICSPSFPSWGRLTTARGNLARGRQRGGTFSAGGVGRPPSGPCKQQQEEPVGHGTRWALPLTAKHDQLLPEQPIFGDEFGLGASEVGESSCQ